MSIEDSKENVILFPKAIDFYQFELTRMLEMERYGEAMATLRFLLQCNNVDKQTDDEWKSLLEWLESAYPEMISEVQSTVELEEDSAEDEMEIRRQSARNQASKNSDYAQKLLQTLTNQTSIDKQLLALDQLAYLEGDEISKKILDWLGNARLLPPVQFKALQTLKIRGEQGEIHLTRMGKSHLLSIPATPLGLSDFPKPFQNILQLVRKVSEVKEPSLGYFAEQSWEEWLSFIYGTSLYEKILADGEERISIWAAALHKLIAEIIEGDADLAFIMDRYGLKSEDKLNWQKACTMIKNSITPFSK